VQDRDDDRRRCNFDASEVVLAMELSFAEIENKTFRTLDEWQAGNSVF
jgi:hypothetical protein